MPSDGRGHDRRDGAGGDGEQSPSDGTDRPRTTRRRWLAAGATAAAAGLAGCSFGTGSLETERSTLGFSIPEDTPVAIENSNGAVTVEPMTAGTDADTATDADGGSDGSDGGGGGSGAGANIDPDAVTIEVVKRTRGDRSRFDDVEVEGEVNDGTLEVATFYRGALTKGQVTVDLTVRIAAGHPLERARTGNGDVVARGVAGDATLSTGNGDAEALDIDGYPKLESGNGDCEAARTTGLRGADTGNGSVDVEVRALREDVACNTANGEVEVGVPADLDADLRMEVGNGDVEVEGVTIADRSEADGGGRLTGRLGDGGPLLELSAGNGDVLVYALEE